MIHRIRKMIIFATDFGLSKTDNFFKPENKKVFQNG